MRDAENATYNGDTTYCTVNAYGECPFCDQMGQCHCPDPYDPVEGCKDWSLFFESWDYWEWLGPAKEDNE